jgi:hypothetical protein
MATITGEVAAERVLRCRRAFAKLRRRWAGGERTRELLREIRHLGKQLATVLDNLDCPPRPIWSSLLAQCRALEDNLHDFDVQHGLQSAARRFARPGVVSEKVTASDIVADSRDAPLPAKPAEG